MTLMDVPKGVNDIKPQSYYINKFNAKKFEIHVCRISQQDMRQFQTVLVLDSNRPLNTQLTFEKGTNKTIGSDARVLKSYLAQM